MIYGIGVDMVQVSRIRRGLERFGDRFATRILSTRELHEFQHAVKPAHFLAKRFAAKEAVAKTFGTGFRDGLTLPQISVTHDTLGRPLLEYTGRASEIITEQGIGSSHLSLTDEEDHALAFVTLLLQGATTPG